MSAHFFPILIFSILTTNVFGSSSPNIIFILTDDQDIRLDSMQAMPNVISSLKSKGISFQNAFAATPVCCPSRTETVSGRLYHNVKGQGSPYCQAVSAYYNIFDNPSSLFNIFHENGYLTASFGKLTNDMAFCPGSSGYSKPDFSSFDRFHVSCNYRDFFVTDYFNKYLNENEGIVETMGSFADPSIYQTAQLGNASLAFITEQLQKQSMNDADAQPFIAWIAPYAPHTPSDPAPWHVDRFEDIELLKTPNYNCDVSNMHPPLNTNPEITEEAEEYMHLLYRDRLRSLLSVDDMVAEIVRAVDEYNAWDNTYIVYARYRDHGYHIGQYRLPCEKYQPYEETVRIPLYIRGPDIAEGIVSNAMVSNVDFLPTFLDFAGISYSNDDYDGRSMREIVEGNVNDNNIDSDWRQTLIIEYTTIKANNAAGIGSCAMWQNEVDNEHPFGQTAQIKLDNDWVLDYAGNSWRVLRIKNASIDWMYGEFYTNEFTEEPDFREFYDLSVDEWQLNNLFDNAQNAMDGAYGDAVIGELHSMLLAYAVCNGADECSPSGLQRPSSTQPSETENTQSTGSTEEVHTKTRPPKTGKSRAMKENDGFIDNLMSNDVNNTTDDLMFSSTVLVFWLFAFVSCVCLFFGYFVGNKFQQRLGCQ